MLKLYRLMRYFNSSKRPNDNNAPNWYHNRITRGHFRYHLVSRHHFEESWLQTLLGWFLAGYKLAKGAEYNLSTASDSLNMRLYRQQHQAIDDLIDKAIEMGLVQLVPSGGLRSDQVLEANHKSREFLRLLPFLNALFLEYGAVQSFLLGGGLVLVLTSLKDFWQLFQPYYSVLLNFFSH